MNDLKRAAAQARITKSKRIGAVVITFAVAWIAIGSGMDWWQVFLIGAATCWGLRAIAGVKIPYFSPDSQALPPDYD